MILLEAIANNDLIAVRTALENGADVNGCDDDGYAPLKQALWWECRLELLQLLVEHGAIVNVPGQNMLSLAIRECSYEAVAFLLEAGADIGYCDRTRNDALIEAMDSRAGREGKLIPLIDLLLAYGAPRKGRNRQGDSALSVAATRDRFDVVRHLMDSGSSGARLKWNALMFAVVFGSAEDVRREIAAEPDFTAVDCSKRTAWELAMRVGDVEKIELLYATGCGIEELGFEGIRPLMHTAETGNLQATVWLIEKGADLNANCERGLTALMRAVQQGRVECVRSLLQSGANWRLTSNFPHEVRGQKNYVPRAIDMALLPEIVWLLVEAGERLNEINEEARARLLGLNDPGDVYCSREEYEAGKYRRFGRTNPEKMNMPFWHALVRGGDEAWYVSVVFDEWDDEEEYDRGIFRWSYERLGKSLTPLPDGRFIEIGGEHVDYSNPAHVYNEAFVFDGQGNFDIYGYPREVFPPVAGHSATLVGEDIYIIGGIEDEQDCPRSQTSVIRLNCKTMIVEKLTTTGDMPGWIWLHQASYHGQRGEQGEIHVVEGEVCFDHQDQATYYTDINDFLFILDLHTLRWRREARNSLEA